MTRTQLTLMACAVVLGLTLPTSMLSAQIIGCNHGDDGFAAVPCCTPATPNIPNPPAFQQDGLWGCINDCELEATHDVRIAGDLNPALCDIWVSSIVVTPIAAGGPAWSGLLICKYARTWIELDANGQPVATSCPR